MNEGCLVHCNGFIDIPFALDARAEIRVGHCEVAVGNLEIWIDLERHLVNVHKWQMRQRDIWN